MHWLENNLFFYFKYFAIIWLKAELIVSNKTEIIALTNSSTGISKVLQ